MNARVVLLVALLLGPAAAVASAETDQNGAAQAWTGASAGYTVIDFAASWCRPCWSVLPRLQAFATDHPEIRVLAISVDEKVAGRDTLVSKLNLTIPVVWDEHHRIARHYSPNAMPATFVLAPSGEVVYRHTGSGIREWDALLAFLEKATKK